MNPRLPTIVVPPLALALFAAAICYLAAGHSLGFYFGGLAMIAIAVPPIAAGDEYPWPSLLSAGAAIDGVGIAWLIAALTTDVTFGQWFSAYVVLLAFGLAQWALTISLRRAIGPTLAPASVVIIAMAWLTWPIWLSAVMTAGMVGWLTPAHPLLALNRTFIDFGIWMEQPVMYQITALGQDVLSNLPSSVWPCVLFHVLIAAALALPVWLSAAPPAQRPTEPSPVS